MNQLSDGSRLTLTYRFEDGSSIMDAPSLSNVRRMADAVMAGQFEGRDLVFVGFSDGFGSSDANQKLSEQRAQRVKDAVSGLVSLVGTPAVEFGVEGFGEAMPIACDDTDWGREVNRRVEVWVQ